MASPPLLDFDALTAPIRGDNPAGAPLPFDVRKNLDEMRKEDVSFGEEEASQKADWPGIIRLAKETLAEKSKDLLVAARLTEALTRQHGFAGLRDGLRLMRLLVEECWDRMYPELEEAETPPERAAPRVGIFNWLNDRDRGASFPTTVRSVPLFRADGEPFTLLDWDKPDRREAFEQGVTAVSFAEAQSLLEDLRQCQEELRALGAALDREDRVGPDSPDLVSAENDTNIGNAVHGCLRVAEWVMQKKGGEAPAEAGAEQATAAPGAAPAVAAAPTNRAAIYRQLQQAADALQQIEPHSPIPYLVKRAVALGDLSFPELMRALIRDSTVLGELDRLLGLEKEGQ